jgi:hypothetical protein
MLASIRKSSMFAISCAIVVAMTGVGGPEARASFSAVLTLTDINSSSPGTTTDPGSSATTGTLSFNTAGLSFTPSGSNMVSANILINGPGGTGITDANFGFTVNVAVVLTNSPGSNPSVLSVTLNNLVNNTGGTDTLDTTTSVTGYTKPPSPVYLVNSLTGNLIGGATGSSGFTSYFDPSNTLGNTGSGTTTLANPGGSSTIGGSIAANTFGKPFSYSTGLFALTEVGTTTLAGGATIQSNSFETDVWGQGTGPNPQPTPAPSSLVICLAGLPMIGLMGWMRRRKVGLAMQAV